MWLDSFMSKRFAFSTLVGHQEKHPACEKIERWGAGTVMCLQLIPLTPHHLFLH